MMRLGLSPGAAGLANGAVLTGGTVPAAACRSAPDRTTARAVAAAPAKATAGGDPASLSDGSPPSGITGCGNTTSGADWSNPAVSGAGATCST